jgi:hypothetical protein
MSWHIRSWVLTLAAISSIGRVSRAQELDVPAEYALPGVGLLSAAADFDADGDSDIAVVTADGTVTVAFNDGNGAFTPAPAATGVPLGDTSFAGATRIVAKDFDGSGSVDLLVSTSHLQSPSGYVPCSMTLLLNAGDGTFTLGQTSTAVADLPDTEIGACAALDAADYDADGTMDVALAFESRMYGAIDGSWGEVDVFLGNGDGTFAAPTVIALSQDGQPYSTNAMSSGDFDGDGSLDLAFGEDLVYLSGARGHRVQLLSGDGTGQFFPTLTQDLPTLGQTVFRAARARDATGDGQLDLLLLTNPSFSGGFDGTLQQVLLLANAGDGTFAPPVPVAEDTGVVAFESEDFDGDATPDVLLVCNDGRVTLATDDGAGGYTTMPPFDAGGGALASVAADFNADGDSDLAVLDSSRSVLRVALTAPGTPALALPRLTPQNTNDDFVYVAPADYDGDGTLDLLTFNPGRLNVMLGTGDGWFTQGASISTSGFPAPARLLVADLNDDTVPDLVLPAPGASFQTLFGSPDGTFSGTDSIELGMDQFPDRVLGDYDEDGDLDVAAFHLTTSAGPAEASVVLFANDGAGNFSVDQEFPLTTVVSRLAFEDLNGDSHLDLFVGSSPSRTYSPLAPGDSLTLLGDGTGSFVAETALPAAAYQFELGDVDSDGQLDLVTTTSVALGNGDGTFGELTDVIPPADAVSLLDLDQDGNLDLVSESFSSLGVALGNGDGTFEPLEPLLQHPREAYGMTMLSAADLNGDSAPDLVTARAPEYGAGTITELVTVMSRSEPEPPPEQCPPPHGPPPHGPPPHHGRPPHHGWPFHRGPLPHVGWPPPHHAPSLHGWPPIPSPGPHPHARF